MNRRQFVKLSLHALLAGGLGASLPACGDRRRPDPARPGLKLGYLPITDHLLLIAHALHDFQQLSLKPVKYSSWPELAEALRVGAIDAAFLLTPLGLALRRQQTPIQAVLLGHRNGSVLTVAAGNEIVGAAGAAPRAIAADLAGRRIAIPSRFSTHYLLLRRLLAASGLPPEAVAYIDMAPPEMVQALASGRIDGFIVAEPFGAQAEMQGVGRVLTLSHTIWPDHICCVLNLREEFIQAHPAAVTELAAGLIATGRLIEADPAGAAAASVAYLGQAPAVIEFVLTKPPERVTYHDLFPDPADFAATQAEMGRSGLEEGRGVRLDRYLEPSFAAAAYQEAR